MKKAIRMWDIIYFYLWLGLSFLCAPIDVLIMIASSGKVPFPVTIIMSCLMSVAYLAESEFFISDSGYLIHKKRKKVLWKIKLTDIKKVYIQKPQKGDFFRFYYDLYDRGFLRLPPHGTRLSFVFQTCEILKRVEFPSAYGSVKPCGDNAFFERIGVFSFKRCYRFCKNLGLTPIILD